LTWNVTSWMTLNQSINRVHISIGFQKLIGLYILVLAGSSNSMQA
jgi:hypothetical protein